MKIALHIGTHKSGSTFLQSWLALNRDELLHNGLQVPPTQSLAHSLAFAANPILEDKRNKNKPNHIIPQNEALRELASLVTDTERTCVISSERFGITDPKLVFNFFRDNGFEIERVICFVRRQDQLQFSSYAQAVKRLGWSQKFEPSDDFAFLNWETLYNSWADLVGEESLQFRNYSYWASQGRLLEAFKAALGLPQKISSEAVPSHDQSNHSPSAETTEIMRLSNALGWREIAPFLEALPGLTADKSAFASHQHVHLIEKKYLESNQRFAERAGLNEFSDLTTPGWKAEGCDATDTITKETLEIFLHRVQEKMIELELLATSSSQSVTYAGDLSTSLSCASDLTPLLEYGSQLEEHRVATEEWEIRPESAAVPIEQLPFFKILRRLAAVWSDTMPAHHLKTKANNQRLKRIAKFDAVVDDRCGKPKSLFYKILCSAVGGFDERYYFSHNPDVLNFRSGPLAHYFFRGIWQRRRKSPGRAGALKKIISAIVGGFDEHFYLQEYPDIQAQGWDPLIHYLRHGWREGRRRHPPEPDSRFRRLLRQIANPYFDVSTNSPWNDDAELSPETLVSTDAHRPALVIRLLQVFTAVMLGPILLKRLGMIQRTNKDKKNLLIILHEGTKPGAPFIGYDLVVRALKDYNVTVMCLRPGPVAELCHQAGATVFCWRVSRCRSWRLGAAACYYVSLRAKPHLGFVNSVEARFVLMGLSSARIPAITLIHEFASYILPASDFRLAVRLSKHVVYPSRVVKKNADDLFTDLITTPSSVIHQGLCTHLQDAVIEEKKSIDPILDLTALPPDSRIIIGVGHADYRKGLDLFVQTAARVIKNEAEKSYLFYWVGGGYAPTTDQPYSSFVADQIRRHGLEDRIKFTGAVDNMARIYEEAHVLLLTSRLDPMPNVSIEAMACGVPVICFEAASGTAEYLTDQNLSSECVAGYLDTTHMADLLLALLTNEQKRQKLSESVRKAALPNFDGAEYYQRLKALT